ncbi:MAG: glycosyltransferase [Actinobacteria bacterium]|nr:glycosyltransferase [Actinomycetota bacterium]
MDKKLVSIILATYNRGYCIDKAIKSVLNQTYFDWELLIINDGSTDETLNILNNYNNPRIKIIENKENIGFVKSLNRGIDLAKGKYIARIDDDDYWSDKDKLKKQVEFLEDNPEYVLVGGWAIRVNENGEEMGKITVPEKDEDIRKTMLITCPFIHSSVLFKNRLVSEYDDLLYFSQDSDMWAKIGKFGKMYNFQQPLIRFLDGDHNRTNKRNHYHLWLKQKVRIRHRKDYPNFYKAYFIGWGAYLFSFLPFQKKLKPLYLKLRRLFI